MFHGQLDCLGFFQLWLSTPLAWSFPRLTWALSTCNQQEGFLNPEQSAIPCQFVMCLPAVTGQLTCITVVVDFSSCNLILPVYRGCHFHNLDLPGVNFLSSALGIFPACLPALLPATASRIIWLLNYLWTLPQTSPPQSPASMKKKLTSKLLSVTSSLPHDKKCFSIFLQTPPHSSVPRCHSPLCDPALRIPSPEPVDYFS